VIVTISGYPGSGKSTLAKAIAEELGYRRHNAGELIRQISKEKGLNLIETHREMEKDLNIDRELDKRTKELGEKEDNFVMEGRLAWYFIPQSIKIFVKIDLDEAAKRVFEDTKAGKEERAQESENVTHEQTIENMRQRMESNKMRYEKLYKVNYLNEENYDIVADTTKAGMEETKEKVLNQIKQYLSKEKQPKVI